MLAEACPEGLLLIEDLGDETLAAFLDRAPARRAEIYRAAVTDLAGAQRALRALPEGSVVASRAFDETLLRWELDHFREWGLDARDRALPPAERARFDAIADRLARRIAAWPRGFVHRDYQSRNLMVLGDALVWIDFQDALLGPRAYDLVALLNDSYQSFDRAFIDARLDDFARASGLGAEGRAGARAGGRRDHRAAQAEGRRAVHLHRPREEEPGVPPLLRALARQGAGGAGPALRRGGHAGAPGDRGPGVTPPGVRPGASRPRADGAPPARG